MNTNTINYPTEYTPMLNRMNGFVDIVSDYNGWIKMNESDEDEDSDESDEDEERDYWNDLSILF